MGELTMCGYRCDLCKAFSGNIKKKDERKELSAMRLKYYALNIPPVDILLRGAR